MNVLYHVPLLRNIGDEKRDPGGISTFIENFVRELSLRPTVTFSYAFPNSYNLEREATRYARSEASLYHERLRSAWADPFVPLSLSADAASPERRDESSSPLLRAFGEPRQPFDVFHSFHHSFPPRERVRCRVRIETVFDLTPLLFPEYSYSDTAHLDWFRMLHSIDPRRDWIICMSEATKRDLCAYMAMPSARVAVIPGATPDGVFYEEPDPGRIEPILERHGLSRHRYILSVSVLEPRKNLSHLIRCFLRLVTQEQIEDLRLVLAGPPGWKYEDIFATVDRHPELKHRVLFPGYVPLADLNAIYNGALFLVYPSLYEGFGLPILEAMQCGVPVITSNTSSLPEVAGDAGLLVDPKDEDQLCHAMRRLWSDPRLRRDLAQKGLVRAKSFSYKQNVDHTLQVYETALALAR